jgi:hypothetical protein
MSKLSQEKREAISTKDHLERDLPTALFALFAFIVIASTFTFVFSGIIYR